ncbi:hypothetical protein [Luethyella okanaganae]|uniref:Uncharacterized protein n=1 Tax=Luethyella okanaganae TaxID=69372 RepID=A0ABW1VGM9_9MICO
MARRWLAVGVIAIVAGVGIGLLAGAFTPSTNNYWISAIASGAIGALGAGAVAWALLVAPHDATVKLAQAENSIERSWTMQASAGAFTDTIIVLGVMLSIVSITGLSIDTRTAISVPLVIGLLDMAIRRQWLQSRQS